MRHGAQYTPPLLSPSPQPDLNAATAARNQQHPMLVSVLLALFLPCAGMSVIFIVYMCLLWYASNYRAGNSGSSSKRVDEKGLSLSELEKLPKVTGKDLELGTECVVCLDEIEADQSVRMVPGCHHGFHLQCADTWLSKHSVCPLCRVKLEPKLFSPSDDNPC